MLGFASNVNSFLLVRHPNVMKKLREEILSTYGADAELSRDSLRRLPYLQNVLKEGTSQP